MYYAHFLKNVETFWNDTNKSEEVSKNAKIAFYIYNVTSKHHFCIIFFV